MTLTQSVTSKAFVAVVAAAMVFSLVAPAAKAATADELQAQIAALMAQIEALKGGTNTTSTIPCVAIAAPLTMNATGADVTSLQNYLIKAGQSIPAGATGYFGSQTRAALAAWQAANGVSPAVGYYGPITASAMVAKCVPTEPTTPTTPTTPSTDLSGEASLDEYTADSADDDTIFEGNDEADVAVFTATFADGDASISRLDVAFTSTAGDAWDAFETISLWVDGKMVAEEDASSKSDYLGDEDDGIIRFSDLDIIGMEDEEVEITVKATVQSNLDSNELTTWTVTTEAMRYFDADDVATTDDTLVDDESADFTIEVAGADDEIVIKTSSDDVDSTTFELQDDAKSSWEKAFVFDIDTDNSVNDIELNEVVVTVVLSSSTYNAIVDDAELVIDGTTITDVDVANGTGTTAVLTFNVDGDVTIDAGERVAAELMLRFNSLASGNEGMTVQGSVTAGNRAAIDAEGAETITALTGAATGDVHTLRTMGITGVAGDTAADVTVADGNTNDYAVYTVEVEVTAFNQDVFISTNAATSTAYTLEDSAGNTATTGTRTVSLSSTGDEDSGYFVINEGETETITLEVTYIPAVAGTAARLQLDTISFADSAATPDQTWTASPDSDYRTATKTIVN